MCFQLVTQAAPRASLQTAENTEGEKKKAWRGWEDLKARVAYRELSHCLNLPLTAEDPV